MPGLTPGQVEKKITPLNQSGWLEDVVPEVGVICLCWLCESRREMNMPNNVDEMHPALPEATVSGQFVQIFGRKENPRGGDVLVKVRHR